MNLPILADLESLRKRAAELELRLSNCATAVEEIKPLVQQREGLALAIFRSNAGDVPPASEPLEALHTQKAGLDERIANLYTPVQELSELRATYISDLQSVLKRLPKTEAVSAVREELNGLDALNGGSLNWRELTDDLSVVTSRLSELHELLSQSAPHPGIVAPLPEGTTWEQVTIRFLTEHSIIIEALGYSRPFQYSEAGFEDRRNGKPNTAWAQLLLLAKRGSIERPLKPQQIEKAIEALRRILRHLCSLEDDPFVPYKREHVYRPKFRLFASKED